MPKYLSGISFFVFIRLNIHPSYARKRNYITEFLLWVFPCIVFIVFYYSLCVFNSSHWSSRRTLIRANLVSWFGSNFFLIRLCAKLQDCTIWYRYFVENLVTEGMKLILNYRQGIKDWLWFLPSVCLFAVVKTNSIPRSVWVENFEFGGIFYLWADFAPLHLPEKLFFLFSNNICWSIKLSF